MDFMRDDAVYVSHLIGSSKKRRDLKLSSDVYIPPSTINAPWVDDSGRNFSIDGSQGGNISLVFADILIAPSNYRIKITVSSYAAGNLSYSNADFTSANISANGAYEIDVSTFADPDLNLVADIDLNASILIEWVKRIV